MTFGKAFDDILAARGMKLRDLAKRADISETELRQTHAGNKELKDNQVQRVADELGVPIRALYANTQLPLSKVPDFRRKTIGTGQYDRGAIAAIGFIEKISGSLSSLPLDLGLSRSAHETVNDLKKSTARKLAKKWRANWGISDSEQLDWKSSHKMYASLRGFVESLGVFVLHYNSFGSDEVSGLYSKSQNGPHTVLINTTCSSKARKLFTLAHEFCHVLIRKEGASNVSYAKNDVERFCNLFAAYLIAPSSVIKAALTRYGYVPSIDGNFIRLFASNLGISQQCAVLRLVDTKHLSSNDYGAWISRFKGRTPTGDEKDPQGGQGDPLQNKRTQYGASLLKKLSEAKSGGFLDDIDIFRLAGIKPKYQRDLLGGA